MKTALTVYTLSTNKDFHLDLEAIFDLATVLDMVTVLDFVPNLNVATNTRQCRA